MAEYKRLSLTLFMSSPLQREAWELLRTIPTGQRTETICLALCREHDRTAMLDAVREAIRGGDTSTTQNHTMQPRAGDVDDDVLGFLRTLQNDGGEDT